MSTHIPSVIFTLDRNSSYTDELYGGQLYELLDKASSQQQDYDFRCYNFRHEAHISALLALCTAEHLQGLDFIGQELAVITDYQLDNTYTSLQSIIALIEAALEQNDLTRLSPLTEACGFQPNKKPTLDMIQHAFQEAGDLSDVFPDNAAGDPASNVLKSLFDYFISTSTNTGLMSRTRKKP